MGVTTTTAGFSVGMSPVRRPRSCVVPCSLFRTLWPQSAVALTKTVSLSIRWAHGLSMTTGIERVAYGDTSKDVIGADWG